MNMRNRDSTDCSDSAGYVGNRQRILQTAMGAYHDIPHLVIIIHEGFLINLVKIILQQNGICEWNWQNFFDYSFQKYRCVIVSTQTQVILAT